MANYTNMFSISTNNNEVYIHFKQETPVFDDEGAKLEKENIETAAEVVMNHAMAKVLADAILTTIEQNKKQQNIHQVDLKIE